MRVGWVVRGALGLMALVSACAGGGGSGAGGNSGAGPAGTAGVAGRAAGATGGAGGVGGTTAGVGGGPSGGIGGTGNGGTFGLAGNAGTGDPGTGGGAGTGGPATGGVGQGASGGTGTGTGGVAGGEAGAGGAGGLGGAGGQGGTGGGRPGTLGATTLAVRFANAIMTRWPDPLALGSNAWEYNHGIILRGMEQVYRHTSDPKILAYIQKYANEFVNGSGVVNLPTAHSFDIIQPSVLLPFLYQQTGLAKYHTAADQIRARYDTIPRNADRGFWHKQTYPNQMWLDSIYMGEPFLMRYGAVFGTCGTFCNDTVAEQVLLIAAHVRDSASGLLYHAWDDSPAGQKAAWADPTTGRSQVIWDRALGWYAMALVDLLGDLPADHPGRSEMLAFLTGIAAALKTTQDPTTGLWFQVVDKGTQSDDWIETSGSGMFVYALKVAVDRGYIDASYLAVANRGWTGLKDKVTTDAAGLPTITGAVQGMSVQTDYAGYVNQLPLLSNSSHGLCAILMAASEMEAQ